jgi:hypothetical protein
MASIIANESANIDDLDFTAFVGISSSTNVANSSIDGVTWTARTLSASASFECAAAGAVTNGSVVAVALGTTTNAASTYDGITWTARTITSATWKAVAYQPSIFAAVATGATTQAASSTDGETWTSRTLPASANWLAIASSGTRFVATTGSASTQAAYSDNGTSWTSATLSTSGDWRCIAYGGGKWVAISYNSTNTTYSTNGTSWNTGSMPGAAANWSGITYGNGRFVAVAFGSTRAAYSTDGISWTETVLPTSLNWNCVAYSSSLQRFAALAQGSVSGCATSKDGISWTTRVVVSTNFTEIVATPIKWCSGDTLTINNGSTVTVNTNQSKFWKTITIADGKLLVQNTSTSVPIIFAMGRNTGATVNSIVPTNGLGTVEFDGDWIEIGTGDGSSNQTFDSLYTEHVPCIWVETGSGTGVYEVWLNATGSYGEIPVYPRDNMTGVGSGTRGKFFTQDTGTTPYGPLSLSTGSSGTSRFVTVSSTTGVIVGASITGTGIPASSVVHRVVSSTVLELNNVTTVSAGPNTFTVVNPYSNQFISTIRVGNGVNGNVVPNGAKVRLPNICFTDLTPADLQTSDRTLSANILLTGGGNLVADKVLFSEAYGNFTQSQTCTLTNCGFSTHPLIAETYALVMTSVGLPIMPDRRYRASSAWLTRVNRFGLSNTWSFLSNAVISDLNIACSMPQALSGAASASYLLNLSFIQNATFSNVRLYSTGTVKSLQYLLYLSDNVNSCTFNDLELYGAGAVNLLRSSSNTFNNITISEDMFSSCNSFASTRRLGTSPLTDALLVDDTKYYFKIRSYRDWTNTSSSTAYNEGKVQSATPYLGSNNFHPHTFGVVCVNPYSTVATWTQRGPTAGTSPSYELFRSATEGFSARDDTTRLYQTSTAATVTVTDAGAWNAVASNGASLFAAVGNNTTVAMSGAGDATWTTRTGITGNWRAICWNGTQFTAVGNNAAVSMTGAGSATWTSRTCISGNWAACCSGPTAQVCAVGNNGTVAMTSADNGQTWTQRTCINGDWRAIAWNGTTYVAVGNNGTTCMTSTDGIAWVSRTITSGNWSSVAWNGTVFAAVSDTSGTTSCTSTDGTTWTSRTITSGVWKSVAVNGTTFCAVGVASNDGATTTACTSSDGITWSSQTITSGIWSSVASNGTIFVAVGATTYLATTSACSSPTGVTWTARTSIAMGAAGTMLAAPINGTKYYYRLRKFDARNALANCSSTATTSTITTSNNFNSVVSIANCAGISGSPNIRAIGSNFDSSGIVAGMAVSGTGVPASTTVSSVDSYYQITLSANLTSTITSTSLSFGLAAGMYVFNSTTAGLGSLQRVQKIVSIDSNTSLTVDAATSSTVSNVTLAFCTGSESGEQVAIPSTTDATAYQNLCLQSSDFTNASWTKTTLTPTLPATLTAPFDAYYLTLGTSSNRLVASGAGGNATQSITTVVGAVYTFSIYVRSDILTPQTAAAGTLSLGTADQAFTTTNNWQRISVSYTAIATGTTAKITLTANGASIMVAGAYVNVGSSAQPPIATTTTVSGFTSSQEITGLQVWAKANSGNTANQGVEFTLGAAPTGTLYSDIFMGTTDSFTPSDSNRIGRTLVGTQVPFTINTSSYNTFNNLAQADTGGQPSSLITFTTSSNNEFIGGTYDFNYGSGAAGQVLSLSNLSNDNYLYNFTFKNVKNSVATVYPFAGTAGTTNNNSGLILQNIRFNTYDLPFNNQYLGCIVKGVSGISTAPLTGANTTATLISTTDGIANAYTTIYDTIFNETYLGTTKGSLTIAFNASSESVKPYTLGGSAKFNNGGRLYLEFAGDYIEYEWPHRITGVSAFTKLAYKMNGVDLGNDTTTLYGLKLEYKIKTTLLGSYGSYKEATPENLAAETLPSASAGFYLKLKLTAVSNMKYTSGTTDFVLSETITGVTSGATAVIDGIEDGAAGTVGTIRLSSITGSFIPGEVVKSGVTNRATNSATNTFALGPSFTSYIDALQIYTTVDQSVLYPVSSPTITLTGLQDGSSVDFIRVSDKVNLGGNEDTDTSYVFTYDYYAEVPVNIVIQNFGYQYLSIPYVLSSSSTSIPVQQVLDRNYLNP